MAEASSSVMCKNHALEGQHFTDVYSLREIQGQVVEEEGACFPFYTSQISVFLIFKATRLSLYSLHNFIIIDMFQIVSIYKKVLEIQMSHKTMNLYKGKKDEQSKSMFVIQLLQEIDIREWLPLHEYIHHGMIIISGFFFVGSKFRGDSAESCFS